MASGGCDQGRTVEERSFQGEGAGRGNFEVRNPALVQAEAIAAGVDHALGVGEDLADGAALCAQEDGEG